jgi:putative transposase
MKYNPDIHHPRSIRLKNYDYSQAGMYFVTICVNHRLPLFGQIVTGEMVIEWATRFKKSNVYRARKHRFF